MSLGALFSLRAVSAVLKPSVLRAVGGFTMVCMYYTCLWGLIGVFVAELSDFWGLLGIGLVFLSRRFSVLMVGIHHLISSFMAYHIVFTLLLC